MNAKNLASELYNRRFHFKDERNLQLAIAQVLNELGVEFRAEVPLTKRDRIDFLVGDIGVEVKVDSPTSSVLRQLFRYAACEEIESLILVTTRSKHSKLPAKLKGKPLRVVYLLNSCF